MARGAKRAQMRRENPCRFYWGSHGCKKHRGHEGKHICQCGETYQGSHAYGEDAPQS